jgi:metallophosphoesterase superfamily enzyme
MRTLIISDLHLGSVSGADLLSRPELRATLLDALHDIDRLVLLGDVLELRHGPVHEALAAARPFFEDLARAMAGRELVLVAGNHDHALIEPWLARRGGEEHADVLGVEQLLEPDVASTVYERLAGWAHPARVLIAYPGIWLRPDVYATHGHYLDCHLTVPTLERLSMGVMGRVLGRSAATFAEVCDYEAIGSPVFAWRDAVARYAHTSDALNGIATVAAWNALRQRPGGARDDRAGDSKGSLAGAPAQNGHSAGRSGRRARARAARELRRRALVAAFPLATAALNRAGLGPLRAEISPDELRRAGLRAMGVVTERLALKDGYVVFGHTHRAGPLPGDDQREWRSSTGARLVNTGSWTYAGLFLTSAPGESPYWPGVCVLVEDSGPPVLLRLLQDRSRQEIRPARRRAQAGPRHA